MPAGSSQAATAGNDEQAISPECGGASARAVSIGRIIDRLCQAPGSYQITIVVPVHRRSPWQITYARLEPLRQELASRR